jgi:uncharacterized iron-regulated membrane protein
MANDSTVRTEERRSRSVWLDHPQRSRTRKWILQIHLWTALLTGLYLVLISLTGSAVVMRREFSRWWSPPRVVAVRGERLPTEELRAMIAAAYSDHVVDKLRVLRDERLPVSATLSRNGSTIERRFDPYTGADLGDPFPRRLRVLEWLVDLHDHLLVGTTGRTINGIGAIVLLLLVVTGATLWWPGRSRWRSALYVSLRARGRRLLWQLHSVIGFWSISILTLWALTGTYFAFPGPIERTIDRLDSDPTDLFRPGESVVTTLVAGHFGRFGPLPIRFVWMALGLLPVVLLVTGLLLWWQRRKSRQTA